MRLLELFCGTKSVGKVFQEKGWEVDSLDINPKFKPTICEDILEWDYETIPVNRYDAIWCSPDCSTFSIATSGKYRSVAEPYGKENEYQRQAVIGNRCVDKCIDIINYFNPASWFIENPKGLMIHYPPLKEFIFINEHHNTQVYYGNYGWDYPKPTHIWSNKKLWKETSPVMAEDTYKYWTDKSGRKKRYYFSYGNKKAKGRSTIPSTLIERLYTLTES
tara:strand:- start:17668 stop:18324 length:657 start_codon:yes stop_codon:yes gene_type:complete